MWLQDEPGINTSTGHNELYAARLDNADGDGMADIGDDCLNDPDNDIDVDGIYDDIDNCPNRNNPAQTDWDSDSVGDTCDTETQDKDRDGVNNRIDNCPDVINFYQLDADNDGIGDICDDTPGCGGSTCGGSQPACEQGCSE